jgi:hypothetical protein
MGSTVSPEAAGSLDFGWISTPLVDVGAVDVADSVVLVCAPPLLLMVTPDPTSVDEDVVPLVEVDPPLVGVDSVPVVEVDEVAVPVVDVAVDPVDDTPDEVELVELVDDDSEDVPVVSAAANP